jgi:hypothetical protein
VTYKDALGGLAFDVIGVYSTLSPGEAIPATTTGENPGVAAEVAVSVSVAAILLPSSSALGVAWGPSVLAWDLPYFALLSNRKLLNVSNRR